MGNISPPRFFALQNYEYIIVFLWGEKVTSKHIQMRDGVKIFAEYSINSEFETTLIYVLSGPGQGCWDFRYAALQLSKRFNVIMFDQRGVLRSDKVADDFNSNRLIEDIEDIRKYFGIRKMVLCGHSYGGQLVLRYAMRYPTYIQSLIYMSIVQL